MVPMGRSTMKEMILHLPDQTYERLVARATAAHKSPEQWLVEHLAPDLSPQHHEDETHALLAAALDALGFKRVEPETAQRLSQLLDLRKKRTLSHDETDELRALMTEADALEVESLQRLAAALQR